MTTNMAYGSIVLHETLIAGLKFSPKRELVKHTCDSQLKIQAKILLLV